MLYLGIDMHSKWFTVAGFQKETGEMFQVKKTANTPAAIEELFATLPGLRWGAMETGTNSIAMHRLLAPYFDRLIIVSPNKVWDRRHSTGPKTDTRDAFHLAEELAREKLTPLFVPSEDIRDWRTLGRARIQVTQAITQRTNQLYALLRGWGFLEEKRLVTKSGRAWLDTVTLPTYAQQVLTEAMMVLDTLQEQETAYEQLLTSLAQADPICQLLLTIPYVGPFTAFILRSEIGEISRFFNADQLISYSGLVPRVFQSGDSCRYGALTKHGNAYIRFVSVIFAQNCCRGKQDTPFKRKFYRLCHTHDPNEIKVMLARDFLAVVHSIWRLQTPWRNDRRDVAALSAAVVA